MGKQIIPTVSIIVAVYNSDKFLRKCLDSLIYQTYSNLEIIIVDDGSSDSSPSICDEYSAKDIRVKTYHQANAGVSVARQVGIDKSTGKYIIHADSDDWVESDMIASLVDIAERDNADAVYCDYYLNDEYKSVNIGKNTLLQALVGIKISLVCWNVFIKREVILKNNIRFSPSFLNYCEDFLFMCKLFRINELNVTYLPSAFYHYKVGNEGSLTTKISDKTIASMMYVDGVLPSLFAASDFDNFYTKKKYTIYNLFVSKRFKEMNGLYPEIKERIIAESKPTSFLYFPFENCVAMAVRGYPRLGRIMLIVSTKMAWLRRLIR